MGVIKVEIGESLWDPVEWAAAYIWAVSQFGRDAFLATNKVWYFGNENDAMLFRLKCL